MSKAILRHLQQQEHEEFCLTPPPHQETEHPLGAPTPNSDWQAPMSREPTLMFSLEPPQPLREPIEDTDHYNGQM